MGGGGAGRTGLRSSRRRYVDLHFSRAAASASDCGVLSERAIATDAGAGSAAVDTGEMASGDSVRKRRKIGRSAGDAGALVPSSSGSEKVRCAGGRCCGWASSL